jgi:hypothetical protein
VVSAAELTMPTMVAFMCYYFCLLAANLLVLLFASPSVALSLGLVSSSLLMSLALVLYGVAPFLVFGLSWNYLLIIPYLPIYAVWKFATALHGRPRQWMRTPREQPVNH